MTDSTIEKADALVHEIATKPDAKFANFSPVSLPPPAPWTKPGSKGDVGVVRDAADQRRVLAYQCIAVELSFGGVHRINGSVRRAGPACAPRRTGRWRRSMRWTR